MVGESCRTRAGERIDKVVGCLKKYNPEKVILFGSWARGEQDEYSDLDFVVIKKTGERFMARLLEVARLLDSDLGKVDVFVYTPEEFENMKEAGNPFVEKVLSEGELIYEAE